jgi:predicted transposase YbfD/YdcC
MIANLAGSPIRSQQVLLLVACATIVAWGEHHLAIPRRFGDFHHGVPCARWPRDLMNRVDPALFASCFEAWVADMWPGRHEFIAIDGKTARSTHDRGKGLKALHTLSAYASTAKLALAHLSVPENINDIIALPVLLDHLAETGQLEGALVTIDAMGCQAEIAGKIVGHKGDYLLALKGEQPTLKANVAEYFRTAPASEPVSKTTAEKGHGRIETRTCLASTHVDWLASGRRYPGALRA